MEFYDVIKKRKSINNYKGEEVCKGSLDNMIDAAMRSPSWKNRTSFKIVIVDDDNIRKALSGCVENSDDKAEIAIKDAPITAVIISEPDVSGKVDDKQYYMADGAIAMEHFILAATAEGYGTMWIGAVNEEEVKKILEIPEEFKVIGMTPVGKSSEETEHNEKKDIREYVFCNKFNYPYKIGKE